MSQEDNSDQQKRNTADQERAKALEASNKAQTALYQQMQEALAKQKGQYGVSVAEELAYWSARSSALAKGSEQYHTIQMEQFKLRADIYQQMMEGKKKYLEAANSTVEATTFWIRAPQRSLLG
jgi:hypothetical protein